MKDQNPDAELEEIKPLNRQEAQALINTLNAPSLWILVLAQFAVAVAAGLIVFGLNGRASTVYATVMGGLVAAVPSALLVYGMTRSRLRESVSGMWFWYAVKVMASIAILATLAFRVPNLEWLPLLVTYVVALKVSWLIFVARSKSAKLKN
jgi:ATP synthase protein I